MFYQGFTVYLLVILVMSSGPTVRGHRGWPPLRPSRLFAVWTPPSALADGHCLTSPVGYLFHTVCMMYTQE